MQGAPAAPFLIATTSNTPDQLSGQLEKEVKPTHSFLSQAGDICSILGFVFTLGVLCKVHRIQQNFLAQARLPDLRKKIRAHSAALSGFLNLDDISAAGHAVEAEIQKCHANLRNLQPKIEKGQVEGLGELMKLTAELIKAGNLLKTDQVRQVYMGLVRIEVDLENLSEDMKWRPRE